MKIKYSFRVLWLGQSLANLADSFYILGIVSLVYTFTHSATLSSLVPVVRLSGTILGGLVAPLLMERFRLPQLLSFSQLGQTLLLIGLILSGVSDSQMMIWLWGFIALISFFDGWTIPTRNALVPRLVEKEELMRANGLLATSDQVVLLTGWSLGGLLVDQFGSVPILWLTVFCFAVSTFSLFFIRDPHEDEPRGEHNTSIWKTAAEGWNYLFTQRDLTAITWISVLDFAAGSVWAGAIILAFVDEVLHQDQSWWGWINASYFASSILGGLLVMKYADFLKSRLVFALIAGSIGMAALTFAFTTIPIPYISLLLSLMMGLPQQIKQTAQRTFLQTRVSANMLPKVLAAHQTMASTTFSVSVLLMGWITDNYSVKIAYIISALLCAFSTRFAFALKRYYRPISNSS